ncbi:MAG: hypothetical protein JWM98_1649 [Thermoleophilia bacterium]|nr:hypothetical protein [Thermoleophilia bacterium]
MRVSRALPISLAAGAALWAWRRATRGDATQVPFVRTSASNSSIARVTEFPTEAMGASLSEVVRDPAVLVEAERELLTVPGEAGETHRRRDQTAGVAAQELAAAQVRQRRNGNDAW